MATMDAFNPSGEETCPIPLVPTTAADKNPKNGRFMPGNQMSKGNPHNKSIQRFKSKLMDSVTPERLEKLLDNLWRNAIEKDKQWAVELIMAYIYGKPKESIEIEGGGVGTALQFNFVRKEKDMPLIDVSPSLIIEGKENGPPGQSTENG